MRLFSRPKTTPPSAQHGGVDVNHGCAATLRDGTPLRWRAVQATDAAALHALVHELSPRDRRWRFHGAVNSLSVERLRGMTCVDATRQHALVASVQAHGGERLIADARWVIDGGGSAAEFALMVASAWRRFGVGERAMALLKRSAAEQGLRWLHGSVLADNAPMLALMQRCGFLCTPHRGDADRVVVEACVDRRKQLRSTAAMARPRPSFVSNLFAHRVTH